MDSAPKAARAYLLLAVLAAIATVLAAGFSGQAQSFQPAGVAAGACALYAVLWRGARRHHAPTRIATLAVAAVMLPGPYLLFHFEEVFGLAGTLVNLLVLHGFPISTAFGLFLGYHALAPWTPPKPRASSAELAAAFPTPRSTDDAPATEAAPVAPPASTVDGGDRPA